MVFMHLPACLAAPAAGTTTVSENYDSQTLTVPLFFPPVSMHFCCRCCNSLQE
jgi:hypothetical protein